MSSELILVVDDNPQLATLLVQRVLPKLGYKALVASTGQEALEKVRGHKPDLMLLDLMLPDTDGFSLLRLLTEEGISLPTILITAHGSEHVAIEAFRLGVQDYLVKPVDTAKLREALERALQEPRLRHEKTQLATQLQQQVTQLMVLSRVGQSVTSLLDLDQVLRRIVEAGIYLTRADEGFLMLLDEETGELYLRAARNLGQREATVTRMQAQDLLVGQVLQTGRPLRLNRSDSTDSLKVATGYLVQNLIHVPLRTKGRTLGVLSVDNIQKSAPFTEADETLLSALADYAAIAIENARLYEDSRQRAEQALVYSSALSRAYKQEKQQRLALDRLKSNFLNVIGHELKTPLTVIIQALEALSDQRRGTLNEEQCELLDTSKTQIANLGNLIDGLVNFATFAAKQGILNLQKADLTPIIQNTVAMALFKAQRKNITVKTKVPDDLPVLLLDPPMMEEALHQLLDNAVKFNCEGGEIYLRVARVGNTLRLSIKDTGRGIPADELDGIWEGFIQRSDTMKRGLEGLGVGLALTRYIVEAHGGTIEVESEVGVGSNFCIILYLTEG